MTFICRPWIEHLPRPSPEGRRSTMTIPTLSVAFATSPTSADDIVVAEELGYANAWLFDTPQQSPDVGMTLAEAALKTSRIGLGPGVAVPSLRDPMVNAAATQTLQR